MLTTGLYTSPHLMEVRERIRINGMPLSKESFSNYFYQVWDKLKASAVLSCLCQHIFDDTMPGMQPVVHPSYFRYLTLMAFHVDVTVLEVGIGGEYDATNVVPNPLVCGITSLGFDHMNILGDTIDSIAWHKSGIFKKGSIAISVPQPEEAMRVVQERAKMSGARSFCFIDETKQIDLLNGKELGLKGDYQRTNAALAIQMCQGFLERVMPCHSDTFLDSGTSIDHKSVSIEDAIRIGLREAKWPGRSQFFVSPKDPTIHWFLDGAHTEESLQQCADWFMSSTSQGETKPSVLVFNLTKGRNRQKLMNQVIRLHNQQPFAAIVFCSNEISETQTNKDCVNRNFPIDLKEQKDLLKIWRESLVEQGRDPSVSVVCATIKEAHEFITERFDQQPIDVLVTGSLYLVGGFLQHLGSDTI